MAENTSPKTNYVRTIRRAMRFLVPRPVRYGMGQKYDEAYRDFHLFVDGFYDRRLGIETRWHLRQDEDDTRATAFGDPTMIKSTPYLMLREMRTYLKPQADDVFLDIGSGAGRVVFFMAQSGAGKSKGIDFAEKAHESACKNHETANVDKDKVSFEQGDAAKIPIDDATMIFLGNPFGEGTMSRVLQNIEESLERTPREIRICYYNPTCKALFDERDWLKEIHAISSLKKPILVYLASKK